MDGHAIVGEARPLHRAKQVHACERGKSEMGDILPGKQRRLDLHQRRVPRHDLEAEGTANARPVEQGMHGRQPCSDGRPLDPEGPEEWELLSAGRPCVYGQPARRDAVDLPLAEGAKIAAPLKDRRFVAVSYTHLTLPTIYSV